MRKLRYILFLSMLSGALSGVRAQDNPAPPAAGETLPIGQESSSADGPVLPLVTDNPPLSGIDLPSLEPHAAPLSYIQPGATISESADSNVANEPGGGSIRSVTRAVGSVTMERQWSHYDLALDYFGGAAYYNLNGIGWKTLQQMDLDQKIRWKRGQLSLRDSFSYLPEGTFGGAYGSQGSQGIESLGTTAFGGFWGGSSLGSLGLAPRILNVSVADVSENLTAKSALTGAVGYAFMHFYGNDVSSGAPFIGSSQLSMQVGYDRQLSMGTQVALVYGYQGFDFSVFGTAFHSHVIQGLYGRRISGRLDLLLGAGPQFTHTEVACTIADALTGNRHCTLNPNGQAVGSIPDFRVGVAAQARLRYKFPRTSLELRYDRFETSGSGLFAGAQSDIVSFSASRPLSREWKGTIDLGYSRNDRLQSLSNAQLNTCGNNFGNTGQGLCPGIDANTYSYGFAGAALQRALGRNWHGFVSYQFNELAFDHSYCGGLSICSRIGNRHVATVGLDWTPRPIRID